MDETPADEANSSAPAEAGNAIPALPKTENTAGVDTVSQPVEVAASDAQAPGVEVVTRAEPKRNARQLLPPPATRLVAPYPAPIDGEDARWRERFAEYLEMGPTRSVLRLYYFFLVRKYDRVLGKTSHGKAKERKVSPVAYPRTYPESWSAHVHLFRWRERAAEWDAANGVLLEKLREQEREAELGMADRLRSLADRLTNRLDADGAELRDVAAAVRAIASLAKESRDNARAGLEMTDRRVQRSDAELNRLIEAELARLSPAPDSDETGEVIDVTPSPGHDEPAPQLAPPPDGGEGALPGAAETNADTAPPGPGQSPAAQ